MVRIKNKAFLPVNRSEAKEKIFRPTIHNEENYDFELAKKTQREKKMNRD